ncbi:MAG TPA: protein translocase subunit SecF [Elusimicrobia bacterium]|nr:MAG: protein-export membrane protein SecF [Elusimicrobia bacterium GWA2_66_18]OGR74115.1 MAG: protein-export membrane protein SecF [Elusimicrobia bacterium GWC2_65_9]HAZ08768.1 protein translocase subunit SecF [Elusimicrobiota bacterium]
MELFKKPNIDFIGLRWIPIGASVVVMVLSVATMTIKGFNYSIEFTGGSLVQVSFPASSKVDVDGVRKALEAAGVSSEIQSVQGERPTFILREKGTDTAAVDAFVTKILDALRKSYAGVEPNLDRKDVIGPVVGKDLRRRTVWAILLSLLGIVVYVAYRFENPIWAIAGVLALFHDVIGVSGLFSFLGLPMDLLIVTALLTIAGYSISDTIVIFDRMREKLRTTRGIPLAELIDSSINETLSRTIITVLTVQIVSLVLLFAGGPVLRNFALAMVVGNLLGTYSSIAVAAPLVYEYQTRFGGRRHK